MASSAFIWIGCNETPGLVTSFRQQRDDKFTNRDIPATRYASAFSQSGIEGSWIALVCDPHLVNADDRRRYGRSEHHYSD